MTTSIKTPKPLFTSSEKAFYPILAYLVIGAIARVILLPHSLWIDEAEQVYLSQWLQADAYEGQPPLYDWIHHIAFSLMGTNLYFLVGFKFLIIGLTYWGILKIFSKVLGKVSPAAILGLLSLAFIFQLWDETLFQTNTNLVTCASVWSVYMVIRITREAKWHQYALLGIFLGLGFLSKYSFVLAMAALLLAGLSIPEMWKTLRSPYLLLTLAGFLVIISPHAVWLIRHALHVHSTLESELGNTGPNGNSVSLIQSAVSFISKASAFIGVWVLLILLLFRKEWVRSYKTHRDTWTSFFGRFLLVTTGLMVISALFFGIRIFHERYFQPFYIFIPVYVFLRMRNELSLERLNSIWLQWLSVVILVLTFFFNFTPFITKPLTGNPGYMHIPYSRIAAEVKKEWHESDLIVVNSISFAGNLKLNLPDRSRVLLWNDEGHYQTEMENNAYRSFLYVWPVDGEDIPRLIEFIKSGSPEIDFDDVKYFDVPYHMPPDKMYRIGIIRIESFVE